MSFMNISLFSALKARMRWHEERQTVLASNIAQADTPKYRAQDLEPYDPSKSLTAPVQPVRTQVAHIGPINAPATFDPERASTFEVRPSGNSVVLEEEMLKVGQNVQDYQLASEVYSKSLRFLRVAVGRA